MVKNGILPVFQSLKMDTAEPSRSGIPPYIVSVVSLKADTSSLAHLSKTATSQSNLDQKVTDVVKGGNIIQPLQKQRIDFAQDDLDYDDQRRLSC